MSGCEKCEQEHVNRKGKPSCTAHTKVRTPEGVDTGERRPCKRLPIPGATVCSTHGGSIPHVRAAAALRLANNDTQEAAKLLLVHRDAAPVTDPLGEFMRLAGETIAWKNALGLLVNDITKRIRYQDSKGAEQLRSEVALYTAALRDVHKMLAEAVRLGIEERLAKVTERQADAVIAALDAAMRDAGIDAGVGSEVKRGVARRLRAVPG